MQVAKFLIFLAYITTVFFLPNDWLVMVAVLINLTLMVLTTVKSDNHLQSASQNQTKNTQTIAKILRQTARVLPFVIFTAVFNWWLDSWQAAFWISLKLIVVCNATMIYSANMTITEVADVVARVCTPLKLIRVDQAEIRTLVSVALMMLPIFKEELCEVQQACRAKGLNWNLNTLKMVLQKTGWSLLGRVNQIEEGLMAKGYQIED